MIDGATKVYAVLDDGTIHEDVKLIATDPLNDIAYLKIANVSDLPAAQLGDSKTIAIGQQVIAIGNQHRPLPDRYRRQLPNRRNPYRYDSNRRRHQFR